MKKLKTLLLALAAGFLTVPDVQAQVMIGGVVAPEDLADGMDVVFEARSGTSSAGILCLGTFKNQAIPVRQSNQSLLLRSEYNGLS